jgi:hypothetical protein
VVPPAEDEGDDAPPIWQPAWDAVAGVFASSSTIPMPFSAPTPDGAPPPAVVASASPVDAPTVTPTPPDAAPGASDSAGSAAAAPPTDVGKTKSAAPPIWKTEPKAARNVTKAARNAPAASAVALRNDGYAALQQRRYREALTMLQQATMMGDAYAPMYIGQLFEGGIGVPRDVGQASYWYGIAINRGNGTALVAFNRMRRSPY